MTNNSSSALQILQYQFTASIRHPDVAAVPVGVAPARMQVYQELFYNSTEGFLSQGFPILKTLYSETQWHALVRDFFIHHRCHTPYFYEIGQEFLAFLQTERQPQPEDPVFLLELAHYEWVELALAIDEAELPMTGLDVMGDFLSGVPVLSPLAWLLSYQFPVHRIGPDFRPTEPGQSTTCLIIYRTADFDVKYLEINEATFHCVTMLKNHPDWTGEKILLRLSELMQHPNPAVVIAGGQQIFEQLHQAGILLGAQQL